MWGECMSAAQTPWYAFDIVEYLLGVTKFPYYPIVKIDILLHSATKRSGVG